VPRKCYERPNRKNPRYFTERDAARVTCNAFSNGATIEGFFDELEGCAGEVLKDFIVSEVEKRIKPELCKSARAIEKNLTAKIARVLTPLRLLRVAIDFLDGLVTDLEDFRLVGLRIPRAITTPIRRVVDNLIDLVDSIDNAIASLTGELDILKGYCDGFEGEDK